MIRLKKLLKKTTTSARDGSFSDRISEAVLAVQRKAADYLNRKTAHWSQRRTKTILILFCMVMGNISLFIAGKAILSANGPPKNFKVQRLHIPAPVAPQFKRPQKPDSILQNHS